MINKVFNYKTWYLLLIYPTFSLILLYVQKYNGLKTCRKETFANTSTTMTLLYIGKDNVFGSKLSLALLLKPSKRHQLT